MKKLLYFMFAFVALVKAPLAEPMIKDQGGSVIFSSLERPGHMQEDDFTITLEARDIKPEQLPTVAEQVRSTLYPRLVGIIALPLAEQDYTDEWKDIVQRKIALASKTSNFVFQTANGGCTLRILIKIGENDTKTLLNITACDSKHLRRISDHLTSPHSIQELKNIFPVDIFDLPEVA